MNPTLLQDHFFFPGLSSFMKRDKRILKGDPQEEDQATASGEDRIMG